MREALAIIAGVIATFSTTPYIIDVFKRKTRPNIVSWFTWTLLNSIAMAAAFTAHESRTGILMAGTTFATLSVVICGLKYGIAKLSLFDGLCQAGAAVGLALWLVFDSPTVAMIAAVSISFIAALPTIRHAWLKPNEETWQTFALGTLSPTLVIVSLSNPTFDGLLMPIFLVWVNVTIASTTLYRRQKLGISFFGSSISLKPQTKKA
jgi:hypothetical protein